MLIIRTSDAPAAIGPYSQGMTVGNLVFTSGQIPSIPRPARPPVTPSTPRPSDAAKTSPPFSPLPEAT